MTPSVLIQQFLDATETAIAFGVDTEKAYEAHTKITQSRIRIYGLILTNGFKQPYVKALEGICDVDERFVNTCITGLQKYHDLLLRADMWLELYEKAETAKQQREIIHNLNMQMSIYQRLLYSSSARIIADRQMCKTKNPLKLKEALRTFTDEHELIEKTHIIQYDPEKIALMQRDLISKSMTGVDSSTLPVMTSAVAGGVASYNAVQEVAKWVTDALNHSRDPDAFLSVIGKIFSRMNDGWGYYQSYDERGITIFCVTVVGLAIGGAVGALLSQRRNVRKKLKVETEAHIERLQGELDRIRPEALLQAAQQPEITKKEEALALAGASTED